MTILQIGRKDPQIVITPSKPPNCQRHTPAASSAARATIGVLKQYKILLITVASGYEILAHLYVAARHSTGHSSFSSLALRSIIAVGLKAAEPPSPKEREAERANLASAETAHHPPPVIGKDIGYSRTKETVWLLKKALPSFPNMPGYKRRTIESLFNPSKPLALAVQSFQQLESPDLSWLKDLKGAELPIITKLLERQASTAETFRIRGTVWISDGPIVMIGLSPAEEVRDPEAREATKALRHPALPDPLPSVGRVCIRGRSGSGRTSAVEYLVTTLRKRPIRVDLTYRTRDCDLVDRAFKYGHSLALVIDDLDHHHETLPWQSEGLTVVSFRSEHEERLRERYPPAFATPCTVIDLDNVAEGALTAFFAKLIQHHAPSLKISLPDMAAEDREFRSGFPKVSPKELEAMPLYQASTPSMVGKLAEEVAKWDGLPRTLIAYLESQKGGSIHWAFFNRSLDIGLRGRLLALQEVQRSIVQTLSLLQFLGIRPVKRSLLESCTRAFAHLTHDVFHRNLLGLQYDGWLRLSDQHVTGRYASLAPASLGLWEHFGSSDTVISFADWVLTYDDALADADRQEILFALCLRYLRHGLLSCAVEVADLWARRDPGDFARVCAATLLTYAHDPRAEDSMLASAPRALKLLQQVNEQGVYKAWYDPRATHYYRLISELLLHSWEFGRPVPPQDPDKRSRDTDP